MSSNPWNNRNETNRPAKSAVVRMLRPADVCALDRKIVGLEWTPNTITLTFSECIDLAIFCQRYLLKIQDESTRFVWAEPLNCLRNFVDNSLIDICRHCFGSSLCIGLPARLLQSGRSVYFYTLVRGHTYGTMLYCG